MFQLNSKGHVLYDTLRIISYEYRDKFCSICTKSRVVWERDMNERAGLCAH